MIAADFEDFFAGDDAFSNGNRPEEAVQERRLARLRATRNNDVGESESMLE